MTEASSPKKYKQRQRTILTGEKLGRVQWRKTSRGGLAKVWMQNGVHDAANSLYHCLEKKMSIKCLLFTMRFNVVQFPADTCRICKSRTCRSFYNARMSSSFVFSCTTLFLYKHLYRLNPAECEKFYVQFF